MFEKLVEVGLLFDFYGKLLSTKQYNVIELYYIHDLSLSEIGEQLSISRQGVYDNLKRAENRLYSYEQKLELVKKFNDKQNKIKEILDHINKISVHLEQSDCVIKNNIKKIETIIIDILKNDQEVK